MVVPKSDKGFKLNLSGDVRVRMGLLGRNENMGSSISCLYPDHNLVVQWVGDIHIGINWAEENAVSFMRMLTSTIP